MSGNRVKYLPRFKVIFYFIYFKALTSFGHQNLEGLSNLVSHRCFSQSPTRPNSKEARACCFSKAEVVWFPESRVPKHVTQSDFW